jgi:hypothetical protein
MARNQARKRKNGAGGKRHEAGGGRQEARDRRLKAERMGLAISAFHNAYSVHDKPNLVYQVRIKKPVLSKKQHLF